MNGQLLIGKEGKGRKARKRECKKEGGGAK